MNIDQQRINRAAAAMAVSNYGHGADEARILNWKPNLRFGNTPRSEVEDLAGHLMETDEHEDMFAGEAESWATQIKKDGGLRKFAEMYPHHEAWLLKLSELG